MSEVKETSAIKPMKVGEGRISAFLCFTLGGLSLLGVLAFMFPSYLTTPELRETYNPAHMRGLMAAGLIAASLFGAYALMKRAELRIAMIGLAFCSMAMLLGGPDVAQGVVKPGALYIGVDWFIIGLITTGGMFVALEKMAPLRREQPVLREDWLLDMKHFLFSHLIIGFFLFAGNYVVHAWFGWATLPAVGDFISGLPFILQFALILITVDFAQYWVHRLYHSNDFFWRVHSVHHSTEHMDWLAGSRLNVIEPLISRTTGLIVLAVLGFGQGPINAYILFIGFHATFIHANFGIDLSRINWLMVTPKFHHWHHAKAEEAINKNYAVHFSFFDRLFGTYYLPEEWPDSYGVVHGVPPTGLVNQQLHPFRRS